MLAELDTKARDWGSGQFLIPGFLFSLRASVQEIFTAGWLIKRRLLTSWPSLILSLSSSEGESSGSGGGCAQVGAQLQTGHEVWHTIGHESLEAQAVYQRTAGKPQDLVSLLR